MSESDFANIGDYEDGDDDKEAENEEEIGLEEEQGVDEEISAYRDPPEGFIRLRPSKCATLPPTVFFEYPPELRIKRSDRSYLAPMSSLGTLEYSCHWERNCVKNAFLRAGFSRVPISSSGWSTMFGKHCHLSNFSNQNPFSFQKVNHFPASWCIGRKDRLLRSLRAMRRIHGSQFDFHPVGFILPLEKNALLRHLQMSLPSDVPQSASEAESTGVWIMKPVASSCGRGIKLVTVKEILNLPKKKKVIVQKYIPNPFLINGLKFDLRVYCLLAGVNPMRVYVFEEGLVRFATSPYCLRDTRNRLAHLTNYSVNRKSAAFVNPSELPGEEGGSKWTLAFFKRWLTERTSEGVVSQVFAKINGILVKTMIASESEIAADLSSSNIHRSSCYELFGCDILLDEGLTPHLIEVNVSPALTGSTSIDKIIKGKMISDVFHLVGFYPQDRGTELWKASKSSISCTHPSLKLLAVQDSWRRRQVPEAIDMPSALSSPDRRLQLLLIEDEIERSLSTGFRLLHPLKDSVLNYITLYTRPQFSDHLLSQWILSGGSIGRYKKVMDVLQKSNTLTPLVPKPLRASTACRRGKVIPDRSSPRFPLADQERDSPGGRKEPCPAQLKNMMRQVVVEPLRLRTAPMTTAKGMTKLSSRRPKSSPPRLPRLPSTINSSYF